MNVFGFSGQFSGVNPLSCRSYSGLSDDELLRLVRSGDSEARDRLIERFIPAARAQAHMLCGRLEADDLVQEGMIGFLSALESYREGGGARFATYADACMLNSMRTAVRTAARGKRTAPGGEAPLADGARELSDPIPGPEDSAIAAEGVRRIKEIIDQKLSGLERNVVLLYLSGYGYHEIAQKLEVSVKTVDNALVRVRRKLQGPQKS